MFTDLAGSTRYVASVGDQAGQATIGRLQDEIRKAVASEGGHEVKSMGDGLLVWFSSARRAMAAGVAMQRSIAALRQQTDEPLDVLDVRVGVHFGEVLWQDDDVFGAAVNAAARITGLARGGAILVSDLVRQLLGPAPDVELRSLGDFELRGLPGTWPLFDAVWDPDGDSPSLPAAVPPPLPTVVRPTEHAALVAAMEQALAGGRSLAMVVGEAGIGKTTLLECATQVAERQGALVLWGTAWDGGGAPALYPWIQALRPLGAEGLPTFADDLASEDESARRRLFGAIADRLVAESSQRPVVVVLDDLQWADTDSLDLLGHIVRSLRQCHLALLCAYRDTDVADHPGLRSTLAELARMGERITLQGLDERGVAIVLAAVSGQSVEGSSLASLTTRTGGNPLFVREIARLVGADGWSEAPAPQGVREVIEQRLSLLGQSCLDLLGVAAVTGQEFDAAVVAAAAGVSLGKAEEHLELAALGSVVREPSEQARQWAFAHDLFRETIIGGLGASQRRAHHLALADELARRSAGGAVIAPAHVANHYVESGNAPEQAIDWSTRAAVAASRQALYDAAAVHYQRALTVATRDPVGARKRIKLSVSLADARRRAGDSDEARELFRAALDDARAEHDADGIAWAALGLQATGATSFREEHGPVPMLEEALTALGDRADVLAARVWASLAQALYHSSRRGTHARRAQELSEQAVDMARAAGDPGSLALCLKARHDVLWRAGTAPERLAVADEILTLARTSSAPDLEAHAHMLRLIARVELADEGGWQELDAFEQLATKIGEPRLRYYAITRRAAQLAWHGRFADAEAATDEAFQLGLRIGESDAELVHAALVVHIRARQGRLAEVAEQLRDGPIWAILSTLDQAAIARMSGEGAEVIYSTYEGPAASQAHYMWLPTMVTWAEQALHFDDRDRWTLIYDALLPYAGELVVTGGVVYIDGSTDYWLGRLAVSLGRLDDGLAHLEAAHHIHARHGAAAYLAMSGAALAHALAMRGHEGDRERAVDLFATARHDAAVLGLDPEPFAADLPA